MASVPRHTRRKFIGNVATVVAASVGAPSLARSQAPSTAPAPNPLAPIQPMKLGVMGIDFTFWGIWADLLSPQGRYLGTSALRMRPTHIWDKDTRKAQDFARRWGLEVVDRYDGMVDVQWVNWYSPAGGGLVRAETHWRDQVGVWEVTEVHPP